MIFRSFVLAAPGLLAVGVAQAATIIDIGPIHAASGFFNVGGPYEFVQTVGWKQTFEFTGVSISAPVGSFTGSPDTVDAYLSTAIGPAAGAPVATTTITVPAAQTGMPLASSTFFTGLDLKPGSYYLTLYNSEYGSGHSGPTIIG